MTGETSSQRWRPWVRGWLLLTAGLVFAMVIVGGATRLTDSGLSITQWQPLLGAIPPLSEADWQAAFALYKQIPQYRLLNQGMSLEAFKTIYWWEWAHRLLGRAIGLVYAGPLVFFTIARALNRARIWWFWGLLALGGLQGVLGWYMVMSGLVDRTDVSQYRLSAHLTLASVIYALLIWLAIRPETPGRARNCRMTRDTRRAGAAAIVALLFLQIAAGGLVAGLDAGQGYNTWPLMQGAVIPSGLDAMAPWWLNLFENALTVQFQHRMLAYGLTAAVLAMVVASWHDPQSRKSAAVLAIIIALQTVLGVVTLLAHVPIDLALAHQGGALVALGAGVWHLIRVSAGPSCAAAPPESATAER